MKNGFKERFEEGDVYMMIVKYLCILVMLVSCVSERDVDYSKISDKILEVPDPGPENDNTLAGIDSDGDGIRDDVQRWINAKYYKNPNLQNALKQYARDKQNELLNANDKEKSIRASHRMLDSDSCIGFFVQDYFDHKNLRDSFRGVIINTRARINAEMKSNQNFHGQISRAGSLNDMKNKCRFKIIE